MNKYVFTNEHFKPIVTARYATDDIAIFEADKLEKELGYTVYVCRVLVVCPMCGKPGHYGDECPNL